MSHPGGYPQGGPPPPPGQGQHPQHPQHPQHGQHPQHQRPSGQSMYGAPPYQQQQHRPYPGQGQGYSGQPQHMSAPPPPPTHQQMSHMSHGHPQGGYGPHGGHHPQQGPSSQQQHAQSQSQSQQDGPGQVAWQDPQRDYDMRRQMIAQIVRLLQQRKPDAPREWLQKLPDMARRLEDKLYRNAVSEKEYKDPATLKQRLQRIAMRMAEHRPFPGSNGPPDARPGNDYPSNPPVKPENDYPGNPSSARESTTVPSGHGGAGAYNRAPGPGGPSSHHAAVLRQQQQRLLLLRHASKCAVEEPDICPHTQHCKQMKALWKHIAKCKDKQCQFPHCVSSRYVLSHYHRCKNPKCEVCRPVKDAIQKQQESSGMPNRGNPRPPHPPTGVLQSGGSMPPHSAHPGHRPGVSGSSMYKSSSPPPPPSGSSADASQRALIEKLERERKAAEDAARRQTLKVQQLEKQMQDLQRQASAGSTDDSNVANLNNSGSGPLAIPKRVPSQPKDKRPLSRQSSNTSASAHSASGMPNNNGSSYPPKPGHHGGPPSASSSPTPHMPQHPSYPRPPQGPHQQPQHQQHPRAHPTPQQHQPRPQYQQHSQQPTHPQQQRPQYQSHPAPQQHPQQQQQQQQQRPQYQQQQRPQQQQHGPRGPMPAPHAPQHPQQQQQQQTQMRPPQMGPGAGPMQHYQPPMHGARPPHLNREMPRPAPRPDGQPNYQNAYPQSAVYNKEAAHPSNHTAPSSSVIRQQKMPPHPQQQPQHPPRPQNNTAFSGVVSLINTLHQDDIKNHISSLVRFSAQIKPAELRTKLTPLLRKQMDLQFAYIFLKPVDPIAMEIPDYFDVVKNPMDLTTIKRRLDSSWYKTMKSFASDVLLVYDNAILYNPVTPDGYGVNETAREYAQIFIDDYNKLLLKLKDEESKKRTNAEACRLCGGRQFLFEPPVYYCHSCNQKIRRGAHYYPSPDGKMYWCVTCYGSLRTPIELEDGTTVEKSSLEKKKNSDESEESWVQCNQCNRWYHQICAMFNGRNEEAKQSQYFCPMCILRHLDKARLDRIPDHIATAKGKGFRAKDLPRTKFSDFIEERLVGRILDERKREAKKQNLLLGDIPVPGELTIRVVLNKETEVLPRQNLERLYKDPPYNYPRSFPHRVKCVLLFQNIDGVDVLIFALYTQTYGSDCPEPNARTLYIAYLDSVFYLEPRFLRTPIYHELLLATFEYEKRRGITKSFIWACPPMAGDDYILYCHPREQRTQKVDMLRSWYWILLEQARKEHIVCSVDNLFDAYFRRVCSPCGVPNFEGDYWPGVTEQYITDLEKEKVDPKGVAPRTKRANARNKNASKKKNASKNSKKNAAKKSKKGRTAAAKKSKAKSKSKMRTRPNDRKGSQIKEEAIEEEEEEEDDPLWPPPQPAKWVEIPQQDALTAKIGEYLKSTKEDFFVVYFHHICANCAVRIDQPDQLFWLPRRYKEGMGSLDVQKKRYAPPYCLCDSCYREAYKSEHNREPDAKPPLTLKELEERKDIKTEQDASSSPANGGDNSGNKRKIVDGSHSSGPKETKVKDEPALKKSKPDGYSANYTSTSSSVENKTAANGMAGATSNSAAQGKPPAESTASGGLSGSGSSQSGKKGDETMAVDAKAGDAHKTSDGGSQVPSSAAVGSNPGSSAANGSSPVGQNAAGVASNSAAGSNESKEEESKSTDKSKNSEPSEEAVHASGNKVSADATSKAGGLEEESKVGGAEENPSNRSEVGKPAGSTDESSKKSDAKSSGAKAETVGVATRRSRRQQLRKSNAANLEADDGETKMKEERISEGSLEGGDSQNNSNDDAEKRRSNGNGENDGSKNSAGENGDGDADAKINNNEGSSNMSEGESKLDGDNNEEGDNKVVIKAEPNDSLDTDSLLKDEEDKATHILEDEDRILPPNTEAKPQNPWVIRPCTLDEMELKRAYIQYETKDPDPLMDNQFFDTRQQFLSLCQGNHYQFDQLRRAKHSSMMVLYHLHNPDEPGFVTTCNTCSQEIKDDSWYKCTVCEDFDSCNNCHKTRPHPHPMKITEQKRSTADRKKNSSRAQNVKLHMELLAHAAGCTNDPCEQYSNCAKMKALLNHGKTCKVRLQGKCLVCRRIWVLLQIHARKCRIPMGRCPVPRCADIRTQIRRAQAAMSDRRIQAQSHRMANEREGAPGMPNGVPGYPAQGPPQPGYGAPGMHPSAYNTGPVQPQQPPQPQMPPQQRRPGMGKPSSRQGKGDVQRR